jgi:AraC-like DNA-binding protein
MDALSEVLSAVHMTGAIFFSAECTSPWGLAVSAVKTVAYVLAPGTERLVNFHLVTEGNAIVRFDGVEPMRVTAGDLVVLPKGEAHTISNGSPRNFVDGEATLGSVLQGDGSTTRFGGGGELTRFVCGYFGCDRSADRLFLAGLPPAFKTNIREDPSGGWLEGMVKHLVAEAGSERPGRAALLSRMAEGLFIEGLRRYLDRLPPNQTGWLAGARDRAVGAVLAALHRNPGRNWTLDELASIGGTSRSVIVQRFNRILGQPPLTYLAQWRLQLAARMLRSSRDTIVQIATDVGYQSEAAFNRAFKREFGLPPAQYRRRQASGRATHDQVAEATGKIV